MLIDMFDQIVFVSYLRYQYFVSLFSSQFNNILESAKFL